MRRRTLRVAALIAAIAWCGGGAQIVQGSTHSDQSFVVVGPHAQYNALLDTPTLTQPVILIESHAESHDTNNDAAASLSSSLTSSSFDSLDANDLRSELSPLLSHESDIIHANQAELASLELLAHQLGAPVLSELEAEMSEKEVNGIEHVLLAHEPKKEKRISSEHVELMDGEIGTEAAGTMADQSLPQLATSLLEAAPVLPARSHSSELDDEETLDDSIEDEETNLLEMESGLELPSGKTDYASLDDPTGNGGNEVNKLTNLQGLDIYVVNTPVALHDNDNELRPVKPPHPMSASLREKARLAEIMKKSLMHDIPQPKAQVAPKTKISTMSAYESSLVAVKPPPAARRNTSPLLSRLQAQLPKEPLVGGMGAIQLKTPATGGPRFKGGVSTSGGAAAGARFQQIRSEMSAEAGVGAESAVAASAGALDASPPTDPSAPSTPLVARALGATQSFDTRDGPPVLLDDILPLKAVLVEELDPLHIHGDKDAESKPNGWGED